MDYGNNILVPFDMVYDIDLGIFKLIKSKYKNPTYIDMPLLDMTDNNFKYMMIKSKQYDPLSIVLKNEYINNSMSILEDILKNEYNSILKLSQPTDICGLISLYIKSSLVKVTIICSNQLECDIIKNNPLLKGTSVIINDYPNINIKDYDSIFIKRYIDVLKIKNLEGKSIFVGNYKFNQEDSDNIDEFIPMRDISILVADTNRVYFIDMYTMDDSYPIYG